jgi:GNAT superfamily N-acetyltransferase
MTTELPDGYEISTDPARLDVAQVHRWLSEDAYWAIGRTREQQDRAIANSLNFGIYDRASGSQVAYARVITDEVVFAYLCDVFVDRAVRGAGLGVALAGAVRDYLARLGVRRVLLTTDDAHGVYAKAGFEPMADPHRWMVQWLQ